MGVYRTEETVIQKLAELRYGFNELKDKQFIGSNQIVMYPYENEGTWDITVQAKYPGQAVGTPGWNLIVITATAVGSDNLVADMVPTFSIAMPIGDGWVEIPQPANLGYRKQWFVPVFATLDSYISVKAQVIANTPVTISVEEYSE